MTSTLEALDGNVLGAFRAAWANVVKATTGAASTIGVDASAAQVRYTRSSGSFLSDAFDIGDEITVTGDPNPGNNGRSIVQYVEALQLRVSRPWKNPAAYVTQAAGASVTITAGVPEFVKWDGWKRAPDSGRPWIRETFQPAGLRPVSLVAPTSRVRQTGVYWLTVFYPAQSGTGGASRLRGKIGALIYPSVQLTYNGQVVRVLTATKKGPLEEEEWAGVAIAFGHFADTFNPA